MDSVELTEIDTLLPEDVEKAIQEHREFCRALFQRTFSGIPDVAYRPQG